MNLTSAEMPSQTIVLLDTNALPSVTGLGSIFWRSLHKICETTGARLAVPEIVLHESVNLRTVEAAEWRKQLLDSHRKLSGLLSLEAMYVPDVDDIRRTWEEGLRNYFEVIPANGDDAVQALTREALRRLPARNGKGARDSLIWLSALRLARDGNNVFLITKNSSDFGVGEKLHPELQQEAASVSGSIAYYPDANRYLTTVAQEVSPPLLVEGDILMLLNRQVRNAFIAARDEQEQEFADVDDLLASAIEYAGFAVRKAYMLEDRGLLHVDGRVQLNYEGGGAVVASARYTAWVSFDASGNVQDASDVELVAVSFSLDSQRGESPQVS